MSMEQYSNQEQPLADVIPIRGRDNGVHRIAGIKINLGRMAVDELEMLSLQTGERASDAAFEHALVTDYLNRADDAPEFGGGDGAA